MAKKDQWREKPSEQDLLLDRKWSNTRKSLFCKRLRKEKRYEEANDYRESVRISLIEKGVVPRQAVNRAWEAMEQQYPPLPPKEPEPEPEPPPPEPEIDYAKLSVDSQPDLVRDVLWAYDNIEVKSAKPEDAPSIGAWSMLKWARDYRNRFFEQLVPKAMAAKAKQDDKDEGPDADPTIDDVRKMLATFNKEG